MMKYHIWTIGCQMNKAESEDISNIIDAYGYRHSASIKDSDLIIINTCVVRQNAEDKVKGMLNYLKGVKQNNIKLNIIVTGCFVDSNMEALIARFPQVDLFFKPGDYHYLHNYLEMRIPHITHPVQHDLKSPGNNCCALITIMQGCNNFCSYCIVPYRRGRESSLQPEELVDKVRTLTRYGVKQVTLLGQNVNSYGQDLNPVSDLSHLLHDLNNIDNLMRIRFLTNHPKDMDGKLVDTISSSDKVCKQINLPVQSGNNEILRRMNRGYSREDYLNLVSYMKGKIPALSLSSDVIVGFPGESEAQFIDTMNLLEKVRFDIIHCAMYSPRYGTLAAEKYVDDVADETKKRRWIEVENLQSRIAAEINSKLIGHILPVLVEGKKNGRWQGRTTSNKLVFIESEAELLGQIVQAEIVRSTAWSLQALEVS